MGNGYDNNGNWMGGQMGWGGWLMMGLGLLLCVVLLVALVILIMRISTTSHVPGQHASTHTPPPASAVLDERFARGEIEEDEYLQRRQALTAARGT